MVQNTFKWKCFIFSSLIILNVFGNTIPTDNTAEDLVVPKIIKKDNKITVEEEAVNKTRYHGSTRFSQPQPYEYDIEITVNGDSFDGRVTFSWSKTWMEEQIALNIKNLVIRSVNIEGVSEEPEYYIDGGFLHVSTGLRWFITIIIDYSGQLANGGRGLHLGRYENQMTYLSMNLHPTYARYVFPCMDEPTAVSNIRFTFKNLEYIHVVTNSELEDSNELIQSRPLNGPPHLWGMIAHNLVNINVPNRNVLLYGRQGVFSQESIASVAINSFYINLIEWTNKEYTEIFNDQRVTMSIVAVPDVATDWHALSSLVIWEPYVYMEIDHSAKQKSIALPKIATAMARQWFGYVIFPENWRYEWVVEGLASYAGWEMVKMFQTGTDDTMLDVNTLFTTEVIQESLLRDSYQASGVLEPRDDLFEEEEIRDHIGVNGIVKYKGPALMRMLRIVLGNADNDYIQMAARSLLNKRALDTVDTFKFTDAIHGLWLGSSNVGMVGDNLEDYLEPWIQNNGYPLIRVLRVRGSGVLLTQESFGFSNKPAVPWRIPITFTTSLELNFDLEKVYPSEMFEQTVHLVFDLGDEDWVLFNIQGQGYYRVTYDNDLWDIIIKALEEPATREKIHPLNRATLIDDALNIARAGRLDYDIALRLVLTMKHETEYAPWRAFVRNMNFLRKRLVAFVKNDEDLDPDIYLRVVRRTIHAFEDQIGFSPDEFLYKPAMQSLTRGLVMDHACRSNYQPCIAAAVDWFYDTNNAGSVVNPNIPHDIRPAVYCTMVREGGEEVIAALQARLEIEPTLYERIVILESFACSQDGSFINELLDQTIANDSPYLVEERVKILIAVAESSYQNADLAHAFMRRRTAEIRNMYGGPEKLEEVLFILADNMADPDQIEQFIIWVISQSSNLEDSQDAALRAYRQVKENLDWDTRDKEYIYNWIKEKVVVDKIDDTTETGTTDETTEAGKTDDTTETGTTDETTEASKTDDTTETGTTDEATVPGTTDETTVAGTTEEPDGAGHAPTLVVSLTALCVSLMVGLLNHQ